MKVEFVGKSADPARQWRRYTKPAIVEKYMSDTYMAVEPITEKPGIRRLGAAGHLQNAARGNGEEDGVEFKFHEGGKPLSEHERHLIMRRALEEAYEEIVKEKGAKAEELETYDLAMQISSHYRMSRGSPTAKLVLNIYKIDDADRSNSFAEALGKIETFTSKSKGRLALDAFSQLGNATDPNEIRRLSDAIVEVQQRTGLSLIGSMNDAQKVALGTLIADKPHIRDAISKAEERRGKPQSSAQRPDVEQAYSSKPLQTQMSGMKTPGRVAITPIGHDASIQVAQRDQSGMPIAREDGGSRSGDTQRGASTRAPLDARDRGSSRSL